jgi:hypothetical protein
MGPCQLKLIAKVRAIETPSVALRVLQAMGHVPPGRRYHKEAWSKVMHQRPRRTGRTQTTQQIHTLEAMVDAQANPAQARPFCDTPAR